jgi:hypothetical protein
MPTTFTCLRCNRDLTTPLEEALATQLFTKDGDPHVPTGYFAVSDGDYYTGTEGQRLVNLADMRSWYRHTDLRRLNGCCGLDGCDGPNRLCDCGAEIGTERSDCWHAHCIALLPEAVLERVS